ncbi:MAG: hypothetical protein WAN23_08215 [Candidatus Acidiferrales bacterium]
MTGTKYIGMDVHKESISSAVKWPIIAQAGFLSVVIPDFAAGEPTLHGAWIGRLQTGGSWRQVESGAEVFEL